MDESVSVEEWFLSKQKYSKDEGKDVVDAKSLQMALCAICASSTDNSTASKYGPVLDLVRDREIHIRPRGYSDSIVPLYSNLDFKSHFRLTRQTYASLLGTLACRGLSAADFVGGHKPLSIDTMLLVTLWYMANQESMRGIADRLLLHYCFS